MAFSAQDFRYAVRTLLRSPGFTAAALLSLGLGIGANTAIFTLANAVFLHPLPVREPGQVLELFTVDHATQTTAANLARTSISLPNTIDIARQNQVFTGVAEYIQAGGTVTGFGKPTRENVFVVSPNYFDVLGVPAAVGRTFNPSDAIDGPPHPEVVMSHDLAQRLYGSDPEAIGKSLAINSISYSVIGVAPPEFRGTLSVGPNQPMWIPAAMHSRIFNGPLETLYNERRFRIMNVFARLRPGVDEQRADANLRTIAARLEAAYPKDNRGRTFETAPLAEAALGFAPRKQSVSATLALSFAVAFVLLIACANLANLSLARAARRAREMGVRVALGAGRGRLVRQLITEAAVLSVAGGVIGIAIGWAGARLLWSQRPGFLTAAYVDLNPDTRVILFTVALSVLSCLLFGLTPVIRASAPDLSKLLNSAGRGNVQGGSRSPLRAALVVGEIALALVALVGAGLFIRSMRRAQSIDLGFESKNLFVAGINLGALQMNPEQGREFMRALTQKLKSVPGVAATAVAGNGPLQGGGLLQTTLREGESVESRAGILALTDPVTPGYFDSMRIPIVEGRDLNAYDRQGTTRVIVISEATARRFWPGQRAIGRRLHFATAPDLYEVVGISRDATVFNIGEQPQMVVYMPFDQAYQPAGVVYVRTVGDPSRIAASVTAAVQSLNPELALINPGTVQQVISQALWPPRMAAILFGTFGLLGLALAVIGVYGVMAYTVLQRTSEIGIRIAVGARPSTVVRMVLGQSARLALAGVALGALGALAITGPVRSLLFDVSPTDPATFLGVAAILGATALIAGGIPAWRASRIDPVLALRQE
jgi:putative ABC transport system permease protein